MLSGKDHTGSESKVLRARLTRNRQIRAIRTVEGRLGLKPTELTPEIINRMTQDRRVREEIANRELAHELISSRRAARDQLKQGIKLVSSGPTTATKARTLQHMKSDLAFNRKMLKHRNTGLTKKPRK